LRSIHVGRDVVFRHLHLASNGRLPLSHSVINSAQTFSFARSSYDFEIRLLP